MKFLLDTHVLLWTIFEPGKLSSEARRLISDRQNIICISIVSLWEISIKKNIGRLDIPEEFFQVVRNGGFEILPLTIEEVQEYQTLPLHHRDPFDRMLIVHARQQKLILITRDTEISKYEVEIITA